MGGKCEKGVIREWVISFTVIIFSAFTLLFLIPNQIEIFEEHAFKSLSPRFFPELATTITGILGIVLLTIQIRATLKGASPPPSKMMSLIEEIRVVGAFATAVFFFFAFTYIGFILAAFLGLSILFAIQGGLKRPVRMFGYAAATTLFLYLFFHYAMNVYFSPGLWMK